MKILKTLIAVLAVMGIISPAFSKDACYRANLTEQGIKEFNLTLSHINRGNRLVMLRAQGFHNRSAAASRWLMCAYTAMAIDRGFKYWVVAYPQEPNEVLVVGFPATLTEDVTKTLDPIFSVDAIGPVSVDTLIPLCKRYQ